MEDRFDARAFREGLSDAGFVVEAERGGAPAGPRQRVGADDLGLSERDRLFASVAGVRRCVERARPADELGL